MSCRNNPATNTRIDHGATAPGYPCPQGEPIILVPATPSAPSHSPVCIVVDDDTPVPSPRPSPRSYAMAAARPAAQNNVVVWPRVPRIITNPLGTPTLAPIVVQGGDVMEPLELPPPMIPHDAEAAMLPTQGTITGSDVSSLPSSSPIRFTTSLTSTPTATRAVAATTATPRPFGDEAGTTAGSYEDFWAQFDTPVLQDANLPSALQTPQVLGAHEVNANANTFWPILAQGGAPALSAIAAGNENVPPSSDSLGSHPPVASRFRKRRRGASPASGERVRKSAKRKERAKVSAPRSNPVVVLDNPWSTSDSVTRQNDVQRVTTQSSQAAAVLPSSMNHTSYADFARSASATTSFYNRLNESGSFPTPHAAYDTPGDAISPPMTNDDGPPPPPINLLSSTASAVRGRSSGSSSLPGGSSRSAHDTHHRQNQRASSSPRSASRDAPMDFTPRIEDDASFEARQRLRDVLSDPSPAEISTRSYHVPMVEDIPEEGELVYSSPSRAGSVAGWHPSRPKSRGYSNRDGYTLPPLNASRGRPPRSTSSMPSRVEEGDVFFRPAPGSAEGNVSYERSTREPSVSAYDDLGVGLLSPPVSHQAHHPHPQRSPRENRQPPAPSSPPLSRLRTLDIFDVGADDNMPDAVRRGCASTELDDARPTPIPLEGDPEVHRHDPEAHLRGMSDDWVQEVWADPAGTSITLSTFNPRYSRSYGSNRRTAADLRQSISLITGESEFRVIAPDQAAEYRGRGPVEWAITGLSTEGVDRLLTRRVWSFNAVTFFPRRRALDTPRWVLALEGFLEDNVDTIQRAVRSTFERPQVRQRIEQMIRANPEYATIATDEAFRRIMATLRVSVYTLDNDTVVANVFLRSPTQSIRVWRRWIQELRDITFGSYHTAIARARRISACAGCLGVDHPTHLCPFPRMTGWNGPATAGGQSYSVDGRELRNSRTSSSMPAPSDPPPRRQRRQAAGGNGNTQASSSNARTSDRNDDWDAPPSDRRRERGSDWDHDRANERRSYGPPRNSRGDSSRQPRNGRDGYQRDGRR